VLTLIIAVLTLTASQAKDHVGEQATVCGVVASAHHATRSKGQPTFLDLDKAYPSAIFTIVIWGENRAAFGAPERVYRDKQICVSGKIAKFRGVPEIVVTDPKQIETRRRE
jgi:hypothetical protein